jgi:hypothetical protein
MENLTYQQVLADHYEENGKNVLVHANEYSEEVPAHDNHPHELEKQEDFQKFSPRHVPEDHGAPAKLEDKTTTSVLYDKHTQLRLVNIDSRFRNFGGVALPSTVSLPNDPTSAYFINKSNEQVVKARAVYTQSSATNYIFKLKEPIKNVISVRLSSIEIPNSFYTFSRARGNVLFKIQYPSKSYSTPGNRVYTLEIPGGNWDSSLFPQYRIPGYGTNPPGFNNLLDSNGNLISPGWDYYSSALWKIVYAINIFFSNPANVPSGFPPIGATSFFTAGYTDINCGKVYIKCNSTTGLIPFDINWEVDPTAVADNASTLANTYPQNPKTPLNRTGSNAADFGLGYNLGFRQTSYLSQTVLYAESILNTFDSNYVFLSLDPDWKVIENETPHRTQLYSFAKIIINVPKFIVNYDDGKNTVTKEYFLKQPTNIHSFPVRLSDPYDQDIDLNGLDFSFTLEFREVLNSALYETMRS